MTSTSIMATCSICAPTCVLREQHGDKLWQAGGIHIFFGEKEAGTRLQALAAKLLILITTVETDPGLLRQLLDTASRLAPIHHRHIDIHQDNIGRVFEHQLNRLRPVSRLPYDEPVRLCLDDLAKDIAVGSH